MCVCVVLHQPPLIIVTGSPEGSRGLVINDCTFKSRIYITPTHTLFSLCLFRTHTHTERFYKLTTFSLLMHSHTKLSVKHYTTQSHDISVVVAIFEFLAARHKANVIRGER